MLATRRAKQGTGAGPRRSRDCFQIPWDTGPETLQNLSESLITLKLRLCAIAMPGKVCRTQPGATPMQVLVPLRLAQNAMKASAALDTFSAIALRRNHRHIALHSGNVLLQRIGKGLFCCALLCPTLIAPQAMLEAIGVPST